MPTYAELLDAVRGIAYQANGARLNYYGTHTGYSVVIASDRLSHLNDLVERADSILTLS